jgi:hypothetical protein
MDMNLTWPNGTNGIHRFEIRLSGQGSESINYVDGEVVHFHLDVRPATETIALNDLTGGRWNRQVNLGVPGLAQAPRLALELGIGPDGVVVRAGDHTIHFRDRLGDIMEATRLQTSGGVTRFTRHHATGPDPAGRGAEPEGRYVGALRRCDARQVRGWAADLNRPGEPVALEVSAGGRPWGAVLADQPDEGLEELGPDLARSAFVFRFPQPLPVEEDAPLSVSVRIQGQPLELRNSPWWLVRTGPEEPAFLSSATAPAP